MTGKISEKELSPKLRDRLTQQSERLEGIEGEIELVESILDEIKPEFKESESIVAVQNGSQVVASERVSGLASPYIKGRTVIGTSNETPISFLDDRWSLPSSTTNIEIISREENKVTYLCDYPTNTFGIFITSLEPGSQYVVSCTLRGRLAVGDSGNEIASLYYRPDSETSNSVEYRSTTFKVPDNGIVRLLVNNRDSRREGKESCEMSNLQIAKVSGFQSIRNPLVESTGKNLLDGSLERGGLSTSESSGNLGGTTNDPYRVITGFVSVKGDQTYTAKMFNNSCNQLVALFYDKDMNFISFKWNDGDLHTNTFTTPPDARYVRLRFGYTDDNQDELIKSDVQLEIGFQATEFEPQRKSRTYYPDLTLASSEDGSVYDELLPSGEVVRRLETIEINGTHITEAITFWTFNGYHTIVIYDFSISDIQQDSIMTTFKNKRMVRSTTVGNIDSPDMYSSDFDELAVSIADKDSGWGANYTPTLDEIKAYFNGWKMYQTGQGASSPFNGTGTKGWAYRRGTDGVLTYATDVNQSNYLDVILSPAPDRGMYWDYYKLQYQLAEPRIEKANPVGRVQLHNGNNQVEVVEGFISRERMNFHLQSNVYQWNNTIRSPETWAKNKVLMIVNIYKKSEVDTNNWDILRDASFGMERASILTDKFDPTATYYVDYIMLGTASIEHASLHIPTSLVSQVETTEKAIADMSKGMSELFTSVSSGKQKLETTIIDKGGEVSKQGEVPTFDELDKGINSISTEAERFYSNLSYRYIANGRYAINDMKTSSNQDYFATEKGNYYSTARVTIDGIVSRVIRIFTRVHAVVANIVLHTSTSITGATIYKNNRVISYDKENNRLGIYDFAGVLIRTIPFPTFFPNSLASDNVFDFLESDDGGLIAIVTHFDSTLKQAGASIIKENGVILVKYMDASTDSNVTNTSPMALFLANDYGSILFPYLDGGTGTLLNRVHEMEAYKDINGNWSIGTVSRTVSLGSFFKYGFVGSRNNPFRKLDYK